MRLVPFGVEEVRHFRQATLVDVRVFVGKLERDERNRAIGAADGDPGDATVVLRELGDLPARERELAEQPIEPHLLAANYGGQHRVLEVTSEDGFLEPCGTEPVASLQPIAMTRLREAVQRELEHRFELLADTATSSATARAAKAR